MLGSEAESVVSLIIAGLTERWGTYTGHFNGDLANFLETYGRSLVLVAVRDLRVVGVGILQRVDATSAQIVRMSVARECRRQGVGTMLLDRLLAAARKRGLSRITLETTASFESAVRFYERRGFVCTRVEEGNQHFELDESAA